jgi:hypothetical protein
MLQSLGPVVPVAEKGRATYKQDKRPSVLERAGHSTSRGHKGRADDPEEFAFAPAVEPVKSQLLREML